MEPKHCAYDGCTSELANACGGVFCQFHDLQYGPKYCMHGSTSTSIKNLAHKPLMKIKASRKRIHITEANRV